MNKNFSENIEIPEIESIEMQQLKEQYEFPEMSKEQFEQLREKMERAKMANKKEKNKVIMMKIAATAAALVAAFIVLPNTSAGVARAMENIPVLGSIVSVVTFRDYQYETDRNTADINVPEIKVYDDKADPKVQDKLDHSTEEINKEIKEITDRLVKEFKQNLKEKKGYQDVIVKNEVLSTTKDYFTLKLICYEGAGSGYQWNYYYTIDLNTGKRLQLKDIFKEGADYITPISDNIKKQMKEQMEKDDSLSYWLNDEIEELNFKAITPKTSFYINEKENVVIAFDEGEVAPMYMGAVEFEIPKEVVNDIRK